MRAAHSAVSPAECGLSVNARVGEEGVRGSRRLLREDVECRPAEMPVAQGEVERVFVNKPAARRIDQYGAALHGGEFRCTDERGLSGSRHVERHIVGVGQALQEIAAGGYLLKPCIASSETRDRRPQPSCRRPSPVRRRAADAAEPEHEEALAVEFHRLEGIAEVPLSLAHPPVMSHGAAGSGEHQHQRVLGHGARVHIADDARVEFCGRSAPRHRRRRSPHHGVTRS